MKRKKVHPKTLGLEYLNGAFTDQELKQLSNTLEKSGITLVSNATRPRHIAGIETLFPQIQIFLSHDIIQAIATGLAANVLYDTLKALIKLVRKLSSNKPFAKIQNGNIDTAAVPNIHFNIGSMHAVLPVEVDDEKYEYFVNKMFETANAQTVTKESYLVLDSTTGEVQLLTKEQIVAKTITQNPDK